MTQFGRTKVTLNGFDGAPGVNILNWCAPGHADIDQEHVDEFHEILDDAIQAATAGVFAAGVVVAIDDTCTVHEVDDGALVGVIVAEGGPYGITGTGSGASSRATQAGLRWLTSDFRYGRRIQGRTFLGPLSASALEADGNLSPATLASLGAAFSGLYDGLGSRLIVWSRPSIAHPTGAYADVTGLSVSSKPFSLTGRRD